MEEMAIGCQGPALARDGKQRVLRKSRLQEMESPVGEGGLTIGKSRWGWGEKRTQVCKGDGDGDGKAMATMGKC